MGHDDAQSSASECAWSARATPAAPGTLSSGNMTWHTSSGNTNPITSRRCKWNPRPGLAQDLIFKLSMSSLSVAVNVKVNSVAGHPVCYPAQRSSPLMRRHRGGIHRQRSRRDSLPGERACLEISDLRDEDVSVAALASRGGAVTSSGAHRPRELVKRGWLQPLSNGCPRGQPCRAVSPHPDERTCPNL